MFKSERKDKKKGLSHCSSGNQSSSKYVYTCLYLQHDYAVFSSQNLKFGVIIDHSKVKEFLSEIRHKTVFGASFNALSKALHSIKYD